VNFLRKFYKNFKLSLSGEESVFTSGNMPRAIFILSVPMILEMCMESLFAVVDIFFLGQYSEDAVAVVALTESAEFIVYSICIGMSMAVTAFVSRRIGENDKKGAANVAMQTIWLALILAGSISILGFFFAHDILTLMGATESLADYGENYTRIIFCANVNVMFLFLLNAVFRGSGNAAIAMKVLWISNGLNIILDPIFIFGLGPIPSLGLEGAAIATTIGRGIGVLVQLGFLFFGKHSVQIKKGTVSWDGPLILKMLKTSLGGIGQFIISSASWILVIRIISSFGHLAIAGYTIAFRVMMFTLLPAWGMANAAATLVGQNLGAHKPDRAEKAVWLIAKYNMFFLLGVSILYFWLAPNIVGIFTQNPEVLNYGIQGLRLISLGYIFFAYGMSTSMGFNGAGDTITPTLQNFIAYWAFQLPLAYYLAITLNWQVDGVYWAITIASVVYCGLGIWWFKKGKWKTTKV
jgi:putative MATE family efflux protein